MSRGKRHRALALAYDEKSRLVVRDARRSDARATVAAKALCPRCREAIGVDRAFVVVTNSIGETKYYHAEHVTL